MSAEDQLDYVERYLSPYKGKIGTLQDAYMSVLYPKAIGKPEWYPLFSSGTKAYAQNAGLDRDKKGMVTVADAVSMVQRRSGQAPATSVAAVPSQDTVPQTQGFTAQEGMPEPSTQGADWANLLFSDTGTGGTGAGGDWSRVLFG